MHLVFLRFMVIFAGVFHLGLPIFLDFVVSLFFLLIFDTLVACLVFDVLLVVCFLFAVPSIFPYDYYRPHDLYKTLNDSYEANISERHYMPFGDLVALSRNSSEEDLLAIKEPRWITFNTDRHGYRNPGIFEAAYVLVGDSFIAGNGTSQESILSYQLARELNEPVINLGFVGSPIDYEQRLKQRQKQYSFSYNLILFYFEGNDFFYWREDLKEPSQSYQRIRSAIQQLEELKDRYIFSVVSKENGLIRETRNLTPRIYSFVRSLTRMSWRSTSSVTEVKVVHEDVGGSLVAFSQRYSELSMRENLRAHVLKDIDLLDHVRAVVFIPTKYRVYHDLPDSSGLIFLEKEYGKLGVAVFDLTPNLKARAQSLLREQKYVFWRDDTHWNDLGIDEAASTLSVYLSK